MNEQNAQDLTFLSAVWQVFLSRPVFHTCVPLAIITLVGLVAWPNFARPRPHYRDVCINNLLQIAEVKELWAKEFKKGSFAEPTWDDLAGYFKRSVSRHGRPAVEEYRIPECPFGGVYTIGQVDERPTCSFGTHDPKHHALPK